MPLSDSYGALRHLLAAGFADTPDAMLQGGWSITVWMCIPGPRTRHQPPLIVCATAYRAS
jgi:hypothetical protein